MRFHVAVGAIVAAARLVCVTTAQAALVIEPVFNRIDGNGQGDNNFPIYDPTFLIDGVAYFNADEPGEIISYASGDPRDPFLDVFHVWNNTQYNLTGFTLRLIGTATNTENPGTIVRGPVDAVWGDVSGDSVTGLSDIFATILVSPDGKEIRFEDGLIPVGGRFTDIHLAMSDHPPDFAGIDSSFTGVLVPEPATLALYALGLAVLVRANKKSRCRWASQSGRLFRKSELIVALASVISLASLVENVDAGLIGPAPYLQASDGPFAPISFDYFHLEDFEDNLFNVPGVTKSAGNIIGPGPAADSVDADDGAIDGSGNGGRSLFVAGGALTFTFDAGALGRLPTHAGIVRTDGGSTTTGPHVLFEAFGPGMTPLGAISAAFGDGISNGTTAEDRFFGWSDPNGILAIRIPQGTFETDHLQYGFAAIVPEPPSYMLVGVGVAAIATLNRRRLVRVAKSAVVVWLVILCVPAYAVDIDWGQVGNPGNAADDFNATYGRAWGSVNYPYRIGKFEVTNAQYAEFLSAKATLGDPLELYEPQMTSSGVGGIIRAGGGTAADPYVYTIKSGRGNNPVVFVNWYDALRFANWLNNGQGSADTESGSYTLLGGMPEPSNAFPYLPAIARNAGARVVLPNEDEWYKAAYHKNDGVTGNYWDYPTATDQPPSSDQPPGADAPNPSNTANQPYSDGLANNYDDGYAATGSSTFSIAQNYLTSVGAYTQAISPYGTFDQAGNAVEWTDSLFGDVGYFRVLRGGDWGCCFGSPGGAASSWTPGGNGPEVHNERFGFRVAMVPEPYPLALTALGIGFFITWRMRTDRRRPFKPCRYTPTLVVLYLSDWCGSASAARSLFMGLGDLPGGGLSSIANDVSADGSVVVGRSLSASGSEAFRWTQAGGMVGLGDLSGGPFNSTANSVSADGSVIVGSSAVALASSRGGPPFRTYYRAFQSQGGGMVSLGLISNANDTTSYGYAVSANGLIAVGMSGVSPPDEVPHGEAFRRTLGSAIHGLGVLPGYSFSVANNVSDNGSVIVGHSWSGAHLFLGGEAFRWTQSSGMVILGDLPGGNVNSRATAVSADGTVVVGESSSASGTEAFCWTQGGGMVGLGVLPGFDLSSAQDVSADGALVVGYSTSNLSSSTEAFLWDATHGMRSIRSLLVNNYGLGASLAGWTLRFANAISADGRTIVGYGTNPSGNTEAWLARLGAPTAPGDFNGDGAVDGDDLVQWQGDFAANVDSDADFDGDSDGADVLAWQRQLGSGVPAVFAHAPVPEPSTASMLVIVAAVGLRRISGRLPRELVSA